MSDIGFVPYIWQNIFIFLSNLYLRPMLLYSSTLYLHLSCKFPAHFHLWHNPTPHPKMDALSRGPHYIYDNFFPFHIYLPFLLCYSFPRSFFHFILSSLFPILLYFLASLPFLGQGNREMTRRQNGYSRVWSSLYILYNFFSFVSLFQPLQFPFLIYFLFPFMFLIPITSYLFFFHFSIPFPCFPFFSSLYSSSSFSLFIFLFFRIYFLSLSLPEGMKLQNGNINMKIKSIYIIWNKKINNGYIKDT